MQEISENLHFILYLYLLNTFSYIIQYILAYKLLLSYAKRMRTKVISIVTGIAAIALSACITTLITIRQIFENGNYALNGIIVFVFLFVFAIEVLWLVFVFKRFSMPFILLLATCANSILELMELLIETFPPYIYIITKYDSYWIKGLARISIVTVILVFIVMMLRICSKLKIFTELRILVKHPVICVLSSVIMICVKYGVLELFSQVREVLGMNYNYLIYNVFITFAIVMVFVLMSCFIIDLKRKQTELLMKQQKDYMDNLEYMQNELRAVHHDYKNVAAGLYFQAEEGNIEGVKKYVSEKLLHLDKSIKTSMHQMNQLTNIKHLELKSLLFLKAGEALQKNIKFKIEVLQPVAVIHMETEDLLRILGILLDNAIEEAVITKDKKVICSLLQENNQLLILIKNSLETKVNISNIYNKGFSTKGGERGIGLHNLRSILQTYNHVFIKTEVESGWFIQVLSIS